MRLEIDQSGRVEETNRPTVVAAANHRHMVLLLPTRSKKALLARFVRLGKRRMFAVKTFAALTFLALKPVLGKQLEVVIDLEYPGYEALIKDQLLSFSKKTRRPLEHSSIHFAAVGKRSPAHQLALAAFRGRMPARSVTLSELTRLLAV